MTAQKAAKMPLTAVDARLALEKTQGREKAPVGHQAAEVSPVAVDAVVPPGRDVKNMAAPMVTQNSAAVMLGALEESGKKMAALLAAQKVLEAFPAVVDADPPTKKICRKGETPVATQKVGEVSQSAVDARLPLRRSIIEGGSLWPP